MKRRNFLATAGVIAGTSLSPLACANAVLGQPVGTRFQLIRTASSAASNASTMWLEFDRWAPAPNLGALAQFQMSALFYPKGVAVPFSAWSFNRATPYANTSGAAFAAGASMLRALRLDYRLVGRVSTTNSLSSEQYDLPVPLQPGSYALIGPTATGQLVDLSKYQATGGARGLDFSRVGGGQREFDFMTFHVAAL